MQKIKLFTFCSLLWISMFAINPMFAQVKTLEIPDLVDANLKAKPIAQLQFLKNAEAYIYEENNTLFVKYLNDKKPRIILTLDQLQSYLKTQMLKPIPELPQFLLLDDSHLIFVYDQNRYSYNVKTKEFKLRWSIPKGAANQNFKSQSPGVAYTINNNLYYLEENMKYSLSQEENPKIQYGKGVYRNEFGVNAGTFWSPDGVLLAFYKNDESSIPYYPLVKYDPQSNATMLNLPYPMAGQKSQNVSIGIYNTQTFQTVYLEEKPGFEDLYMTGVTWHPSAKEIYVVLLNRAQKHLRVACYNAQTGELKKIIFEELNQKYVEPEDGLLFRRTEPNEFLWLSERDGYNHLYLYHVESGLKKQLTSGAWAITQLLGIDEDDQRIYFMATKESPLEEHLYSVDIKTGTIAKITQEPGVHNISMHKSGKYFIDKFSNAKQASRVQILTKEGKIIEKIQDVQNPVQNYALGKTDIRTIKAADGTTDLYTRLIKPYNFDSTKKYPVIVYVYGGPHAQLITNTWLWGSNLFHHYLAQEGYLVFTVDSRGSANRGFDFESAIYRNVGTVEIEDQMKGIAYLKALPYVDTARIGVDGWSYGGFMTIRLKLFYPEVFKVATAGGPVIDWRWYEIMYGERYMDAPDANPHGYEEASLLNHIDKLKGKLLIMQGGVDDVVLPQNAFSFIQECIKQRKQVDMFVFPAHPHNVRGLDRAYLYQKIYDYYKQNL
ncbi:MAG: DPP IV N-terminal domain-containing protein [Bacteroidales bacterium]